MNLWSIYHKDIPDFLFDAAQTPAIQRLRRIGMNCGCEYTAFPEFSMCRPYSRYDHSMGVALIVWHFTKDKAQALSALLHDIATPVFAHVIDFANGDHMTQESTESRTEDMIRNSPELMAVIDQHGLCAGKVVDYHIYPIADNHAPMLCADRLEYTLGNAVNYQFIDRTHANQLYQNLIAGKNEAGQEELLFRTSDAALQFATASLRCSKVYVSDADRYAMQILAEIILEAMHAGILSEKDLYTTEDTVIQKLTNSVYRKNWEAFCRLCNTSSSKTPNTAEKWRIIQAKKRYIDPYVAGKGRVTDIYPSYYQDLQQFIDESQDYWVVGR